MPSILLLTALFGLWAISVDNVWLGFPSLASVVDTLWNDRSLYLYHASSTAFRMIYSFFISLICALLSALLLRKIRWIRSCFFPLFVLFKNLPIFCIAPIVFMISKNKSFSLYLPLILSLTFPLTIHMDQGLSHIPSEMLRYMRMHGLSIHSVWRLIIFPLLFRSIGAGVKVIGAFCTTITLSIEYHVSSEGMGVLMHQMKQDLDISGLYASILVTIILSASLFGITSFIESRCEQFSFSRS